MKIDSRVKRVLISTLASLYGAGVVYWLVRRSISRSMAGTEDGAYFEMLGLNL